MDMERWFERYEKLLDKTVDLRRALRTIAKWEFPATGKEWEDGTPMSYSAAYGSNGERDYMRKVALDALNKFQYEDE